VSTPTSTGLLPFVQLEFPGTLGLADGRYLVRSGDEPSEVVVVENVGAAPAAGRRRSRFRSRPADESAAVLPITRITVVRPTELGGAAAAERRLAELARESDAAESEVQDAVVLINRAISAHRAASQDPYTQEVAAAHATVVRIGFGTGDELAHGRWTEAREVSLPQERRRRAEALQPTERVAAVLGGREEVLACETLLLRARLDLDQDRPRAAALQLRVGLEALLNELAEDDRTGQREDLAGLQARRDGVVEAANAAVRGELGPRDVARVYDALAICERMLRRRRILPG
jgi:hypothetical protein